MKFKNAEDKRAIEGQQKALLQYILNPSLLQLASVLLARSCSPEES